MSKVKILTAIAGVALAVAPVAVIAAADGHSAALASRPAAVSAAQPAGGTAPTATPTPTPTSSTGSNDDTPWG